MEADCFKNYLAQCSPFQLPQLWNGVGSDRFAYVVPISAEESSQKLLADHSESDLIEAGLFRRDNDGKLTLHPCLAIPNATLLALTDLNTGNVFDIVSDEGCIKDHLAPVLLVRNDQTTQAAVDKSTRTLFLTGNLIDSIVLRSLGLAAVPVYGFCKFREQDLVLLAKRFQIEVVDGKKGLPTNFQASAPRI